MQLSSAALAILGRTDGRLLLRFAIGALSLGRARLLDELRVLDEATHETPYPSTPVRRRHQLLGALVIAPAALASTARATRALYARSAGRIVHPALRWLRASRPGRRVAAARDRLRDRAGRTLARWGTIGHTEEAAGRALATAALRRIYVEVFDRMGESAQLQQLIHEQSAGLTRGVVDELRELGVEADARAETFVRRLWRRAR